jgi:RND family efflux transporter MFP subunit
MRQNPAVAVALAGIATRDLAEHLDLSGTLEARRQVALAFRSAGRLADVRVELGDRVSRGQVVATQDATDVESRVRQADHAVASAKASLLSRRVDAANLERQWRRDRDLLAKDFIARQDVENGQARLDSARAQVRAAEADVARQEAARAEARVALAQATLTAPMAGVVAARHADPGTMVSGSAPVVTLVNPDALKTVVQVPESALAAVRVGTPATLSVDAYPAMTFSGRVARIGPAVSPETREAPVELAFSSAGARLRPGMFARVSLRLRVLRNSPAIPLEALVVRQGTEGVFVAEGDKARFHKVTTGLRSGAWAALVAEPPVGAEVVTLGNHLLKDGSAILTGDASPSAGKRGRRRGPRAPRD